MKKKVRRMETEQPENKKETVEIGSEEPMPETTEVPQEKKFSMWKIVLICILILIGAGLALWARSNLW